MPTHVADVRLARTVCVCVCVSYPLSPAVTSCDSWLKVGSSGPVGPDQPGETPEMRRDRGNRTWWHPTCRLPPLFTASCQPHAAAILNDPQVVTKKFRSCAWKANFTRTGRCPTGALLMASATLLWIIKKKKGNYLVSGPKDASGHEYLSSKKKSTVGFIGRNDSVSFIFHNPSLTSSMTYFTWPEFNHPLNGVL